MSRLSARSRSLLVALGIVVIGAASLLFWRGTSRSDATSAGAPAIGSQLHSEAIPWTSHDRTLLLAIRRGCHFCERSMPFYRRLAALQAAGKLHAYLVAVTPDDPASTSFLLKSRELDVQAIPDVPLSSINVDGTPTAVLVDRTGRVLRVWSGELSNSSQQELISAL